MGRKNWKKWNKCILDFHQYGTVRSFGDNISNPKIYIVEAEEFQSNL